MLYCSFINLPIYPRKFVWSYTLSAVDGAALNMESWRKSTRYYHAKQSLRVFFWLAAFFMVLVPVAVHNMSVGPQCFMFHGVMYTIRVA